MSLEELVDRAVAGEQRAIARLLTSVEASLENAAEAEELVGRFPPSGRVIGFFGPPGVGKSTLIAALVPILRKSGERVAVVANDPTSIFGGGALLGDRVRMLSLARDPGVFIRSAAARDPLRSLGATTVSSAEVLRRIGFGWVLVEAVGSGQSDLGTRLVADTSVLVLVPGLGDYIQAMKAGVMDVADLIAVNKADLPDAAATVSTLRRAVAGTGRPDGLVPAVVPVAATDGRGLDALLDAVEADLGRDRDSGWRRALVAETVTDLVLHAVAKAVRERLPAEPGFIEAVDAVVDGRQSIARTALGMARLLLRDEAPTLHGI